MGGADTVTPKITAAIGGPLTVAPFDRAAVIVAHPDGRIVQVDHDDGTGPELSRAELDALVRSGEAWDLPYPLRWVPSTRAWYLGRAMESAAETMEHRVIDAGALLHSHWNDDTRVLLVVERKAAGILATTYTEAVAAARLALRDHPADAVRHARLAWLTDPSPKGSRESALSWALLAYTQERAGMAEEAVATMAMALHSLSADVIAETAI